MYEDGAAATFDRLRLHARGHYHVEGCYTCGAMVDDDDWVTTDVSFADLRLHRMHDFLPNCKAVHDLLTDEHHWMQSEHRICRDCSDIVFTWY